MSKILIIDLANTFYLCRSKRINDASINGGWPLIGEFLVKFNYWLRIHNPTSVIFLDDGYPHWRYEKLLEYKSGRDEVRQKDPLFEDFRRQRQDIKKQIKLWFPAYFLRNQNLEADDLAFIVSKYLRDIGCQDEIIAISNDLDWHQLVTKIDNIKVWNPRSKVFTSSQDIDYDFVLFKSILGDKSDKILGFKGVGNVGAEKYTRNPNLFENWYKGLNDIEKNRLETNKFLIDFQYIPSIYIEQTIQELNNLTLPKFDKALLDVYCTMRKAFRFNKKGSFEEKCNHFYALKEINFVVKETGG